MQLMNTLCEELNYFDIVKSEYRIPMANTPERLIDKLKKVTSNSKIVLTLLKINVSIDHHTCVFK